MENQNILDGNRIISIFDNKYQKNSLLDNFGNYHISWDWLMPVVEKIESLGYFLKISTKMVSVARDNKGNNDSYLIKAQFGDDSKLQKTYNCVIETIKYINYLNKKE